MEMTKDMYLTLVNAAKLWHGSVLFAIKYGQKDSNTYHFARGQRDGLLVAARYIKGLYNADRN